MPGFSVRSPPRHPDVRTRLVPLYGEACTIARPRPGVEGPSQSQSGPLSSAAAQLQRLLVAVDAEQLKRMVLDAAQAAAAVSRQQAIIHGHGERLVVYTDRGPGVVNVRPKPRKREASTSKTQSRDRLSGWRKAASRSA